MAWLVIEGKEGLARASERELATGVAKVDVTLQREQQRLRLTLNPKPVTKVGVAVQGAKLESNWQSHLSWCSPSRRPEYGLRWPALNPKS